MKASIDIRLEDTCLGYGNVRILEHLSFTLEGGKIHCVFGRNGSGKTTFLKTISGHIPCLSGRLFIGDEESENLSTRQRARLMSSVFTERPLIANMRVSDYVGYGRYVYTDWLGTEKAEDKRRVEEVMELCGIRNISGRNINELSDGEMQITQIARALAQDTGLMLLDEIVSHLDLVNKAEIYHLLKRSNDGRRTVLFTSHDLQFSSQLADNFIVINNGVVNIYDKQSFLEKKIYLDVLKSEYLEFDESINSLKFRT